MKVCYIVVSGTLYKKSSISCVYVHNFFHQVESDAALTPHKLIFCTNSFSPSNITWMLSWKRKEKKIIG